MIISKVEMVIDYNVKEESSTITYNTVFKEGVK